MTLVSDIILSAYRDANSVSINAALSPAEQAQGLSRLQSLVASVFGNEAGENLNDWPLGNFGRDTEYYIDAEADGLMRPVINSRLVATAEQAKTVFFPAIPSDGSRMALIDPYARLATYPVTLDGNGRTIEEVATLILDENSLNRVWFFRADQGNWARVTSLGSFSEMPFPLEFDDYFIIALAMRLNPSFGRKMDVQSAARFKLQRSQLLARYTQSAPLEINSDLSHTSKQGYNDSWPGTSQEAWEAGRFRG